MVTVNGVAGVTVVTVPPGARGILHRHHPLLLLQPGDHGTQPAHLPPLLLGDSGTPPAHPLPPLPGDNGILPVHLLPRLLGENGMETMVETVATVATTVERDPPPALVLGHHGLAQLAQASLPQLLLHAQPTLQLLLPLGSLCSQHLS